MKTLGRVIAVLVLIVVAGAAGLYLTAGDTARLAVAAGTGPDPVLPAPEPTLIPTVAPARAVGWAAGEHPNAAAGLRVTALSRGLIHPRWLYVLPNGDVLVAESNSPRYPGDSEGIKGKIAGYIMDRAGAGVPSPNRISLLRSEAAGTRRYDFAENLVSPFGMVLVGNDLYVADTDALLRFDYAPGMTRAGAPETILPLPGGPIDHHWTKNVVASADGARLYVSVGSNSNIAEHGMAAEEGRAAIWEIDRATRAHRIFASGLRNPVGMDFEPATGALWTAVNERDELGSDLVPDYMTAVRDGGFYGWPYSYYGQHVDTRVQPQDAEMVARAIKPDYALGPHTASLGLAFSRAGVLTADYANGVFVGQHGSWNRDPPSGYRVVFVPFADGRPAGMPRDVLAGFLDARGQARGRPVGVAIDREGGLLVADDVGNTVWRVTAAGGQRASIAPAP